MYTTHHCQQLKIIPNSQNWTPKHLHVLIFPTIAERSNIYTELFNFWLVVNIFFLYPEPSVLVAFNVIGRGTLFDPRAFVTCLLGVEGGLIYQKVIFFPKGEKGASSVSECKMFRNSILNRRVRLYHFSSKFDCAPK